ncbi:DNA internalization-related competence protein ComEC/Rec2 [Variovorax sp. JS1663]|uniref:DNA internalization-related competence protein ComEC/Rec2 n=1 Tax=Variovorax sp. JS1663 TaxID=1851577 RepID=UPI000B348883|nr:DNA internalization-related competence protein ComEC/Rec2 [Variovorax sp. JS1663]OUL98344.1 DNA internalization-related competence protein ComEC/Rec2 [Variovorax sp. JS1663]
MAGSVAGAALQLQQAVLWDHAAYVALLVGAAAGWSWRPRAGRRQRLLLPALLLAGALGGAGLAGWRSSVQAANALEPALEGRDLQVLGVVSQMPQRGEGGVRFLFDVEAARWAGDTGQDPPPRVPARIALGWYADNTGLWGRAPEQAPRAQAGEAPGPVHAGERWRLQVRLKAPHGNLNPHGFDLELRLWEQGVQASGYVRTGAGDARPQPMGRTWRHPVERAREAVRDAVFERVPDRRQAGVIAALVTGDQAAIERADWDMFRATGVAHLMSISGLHITMFAWLAGALVGMAWRRSTRLMLWWPAPQAALAGGVVLAALYALFSGWGLPAQRTVWMLATAALLRLTGRQWPWPFVWLCTGAVVVAFDPWGLLQPGFWLSFVAVGVLFAAGSPDETGGGAVARLARMWREQWTVTLALTPLGLLLFQQLSVVGLAANMLAIPWVTLVITPLAMLGAAVPLLWDLAARAVQLLAWLLEWLAGLPLATLSAPAPALWAAIAGVTGGALLAMRLPWSLRVQGLPLLLPALLWQAPRPADGEFELLAADVGQGNAVLVRTARHSLLYDAGPRYSLESDAGHRVLVPLLRALDERVDTVVLSHRDSDHTGGAPAVLAMQPGAELRSSVEAGHPLRQLRPVQRCLAGQSWTWDGVRFEILHPEAGDYAGFTRPNAVSCVLRIGNGRAAALLAGDIERLQEAALASRAPGLQADLLLVPHHGSKTSSSPALLDAVRPRIALVQAGWRNRFGHPAAEVLARYAERGVAVVDSAHCGAAHWASTQPHRVRCERQEARRYWHHQPP